MSQHIPPQAFEPSPAFLLYLDDIKTSTQAKQAAAAMRERVWHSMPVNPAKPLTGKRKPRADRPRTTGRRAKFAQA